MLLSASFAQRSSLSSSFSFSFSTHLEAENMVSFQHEQLLEVMLANEAYTLPHSLLKHIFAGKLVNQELEEQPAKLEASLFKELLPKLPETDELKFFLGLGERAMKSFLDLQQHPAVYHQLADNLGQANPTAKLIYQELAKADTGAALDQKTSAATRTFWKATSKSLNRTLQETLQSVEQLIEQQEAEVFFEGAWQEPVPAAASASEEASGRVDGSFGSLQCGEGNLPLHLKLELAHKLGSFKP